MIKNNMQIEDLKKYLKEVIELEMKNYELEKLQDILYGKLSSIDDSKKSLLYKKPELYDDGFLGYIKSIFIGIFVGGFFGALGGVLVWLVVFIFNILFNGNFLVNIVNIFFGGFDIEVPILPYIHVCTIIGCVIGIIRYFSEKVSDKHRFKENVNLSNDIDKQIAQYSQITPYYSAQLKECKKNLEKINTTLQQYYSLNIIYPDYRGLVPIATIYGYLESGRCFSLYGHEGAYNLYSSEARLNQILVKLDDIIDSLDDLRRGQNILKQELKNSNYKLDSLSNSLDNINNNIKLNAYYSEISAINSEHLKQLSYFRYRI